MKFLIDMNLSPLWVRFLAGNGFDSVHWSSIGLSSAPDTEIMDYAAANQMIVFTHDLDFGALLANRKTSGRASFKFARRMSSRRRLAISCCALCAPAAPNSRTEPLVTVDPNRHRIRLLPICKQF
jgi:uncharacterized protein with PIN domain